MDIYDQILENLELERELGTRAVEMDRALLVPPEAAPIPAAKAIPDPGQSRIEAAPSGPMPPPASQAAAERPPQGAAGGKKTELVDIAFIIGKPLSAAGSEAMERTIAAMKRIRPELRAAVGQEICATARVTVFLGSDAMKRHLPAVRPMRGKWIELDGRPALMTFSPDYIFSHFQEGSPRMLEAKRDMWNDIKSAMARLPG